MAHIKEFLLDKVSSFTYLNITQFLGALNDNIYKLLIVYFLIELEGKENGAIILAATGAIFVIPFLLFSAISGTLADRFSKSTIIVLTKILELVTMAFGLIAFLFKLKWGSYLILFLMATQSAVFGPSKYGIIPEIVASDKVSRANGIMSSFTYFAIILGTFLASFVTEITGRNFVLSSMLCIVIALLGLATSFFIEYTPPSGSSKRITLRIVSEIYRTFKKVWHEALAPGVLMTAMCGSAFFLFVGAFMQLNLIPFAMQSLGMSDVQGGYLFLSTAVGIGIGSYLAGRISGSSVELGLIPIAALAMAIGMFVLPTVTTHPYSAFYIVAILGIAGGLYLVPLDTYIQVASPEKMRGQVIAAVNFLSFVGVLLASLTLYLIAEVFCLPSTAGFIFVGSLTVCFAALLLYQFFDFLTRLIGSFLSRLHFRTSYHGLDKVPQDPAVYVCHQTAWHDTLLMLGAQRRRIRFFVQEEPDHPSSWLKKLYHLLRIVNFSSIEILEDNPKCLNTIKTALKKGFSICIFVKNKNVEEEIEKLQASYSFHNILEERKTHVVAVMIDKGRKEGSVDSFFSRFLKKIHVPASVTFH